MTLYEIANLILPLGFISTILYVVIASSPIYAVLGLIVAMLCFAAILLTIGFELLGLVYIMVYIGAVMVLFLWVVMTIPLKKDIFGFTVHEMIILFGFSTFLLVAIVLWLLGSPTSILAALPHLKTSEDVIFAKSSYTNIIVNFLDHGSYWPLMVRYVYVHIKHTYYDHYIPIGPAMGLDLVPDWAFRVNKPKVINVMYNLFHKLVAQSFDAAIYQPVYPAKNSAYTAYMARCYIDYMRYEAFPGRINPDLDPTFGLDYLGSWSFEDAKPILMKKQTEVKLLEITYVQWSMATVYLYSALHYRNVDFHSFLMTRASASMFWQHLNENIAAYNWVNDWFDKKKFNIEYNDNGLVLWNTPETPPVKHKHRIPNYIPKTNIFFINIIIDIINFFMEEISGVSKYGYKEKVGSYDCTNIFFGNGVPISGPPKTCYYYNWKPWPKPKAVTSYFIPFGKIVSFKPDNGAWGDWAFKIFVVDLYPDMEYKLYFNWSSLVQGLSDLPRTFNSSIGRILYRHLSVELMISGLILVVATIAAITLVRFQVDKDSMFIKYNYGNSKPK